ncbi:nuclear transport factor 2 family protein [Streptomyces sp. NPDC056149]|uniref:nuclear transport factor 2 family protein n=1 Tax=unclassified Streptomyces TaxID=2593676 RepID=UPI0023813153|nr:nuclear transport factor 2 family protein [Streptomyces sp. WZ-12]
MPLNDLDPVVAKFVDALNTGDSNDLFGLLTPDATMSDDGTDRDLRDWLQSEALGSNGRMDVESVADGGTALVANYTNDRWGAMRTAWRFTVSGDKISRFETGQA